MRSRLRFCAEGWLEARGSSSICIGAHTVPACGSRQPPSSQFFHKTGPKTRPSSAMAEQPGHSTEKCKKRQEPLCLGSGHPHPKRQSHDGPTPVKASRVSQRGLSLVTCSTCDFAPPGSTMSQVQLPKIFPSAIFQNGRCRSRIVAGQFGDCSRTRRVWFPPP